MLHLRWRGDDVRIQREAEKLEILVWKYGWDLKQGETRIKKHINMGLCDSFQGIMILQDQIKSFQDG